MSDTALYLALDQGGHSSRAMVFDRAGRVRAAARVPVGVRFPRPGWVEQDADELADSLCRAAVEALAELGRDAARVQAAGLATQRSNIVCWDLATGAVLSPAISWQDRRAHRLMAGFERRRARIHRRTGLYPNAHYGASKLRWCLEHLDPVRQAGARGRLACGPLASFLTHRLTAEAPFLVDPVNAQRTLLWDLRRGDWDPGLLEEFGIPRALLPRPVPSLHPYGRLDVAGHAIPLRLVTGDQSAALHAFGPPAPDSAWINLGTGAFVQRPTGRLVRSVPGLLSAVVHSEGARDHYALEGTVNGAGTAFNWMQETLPVAHPEEELPCWLEAAEDGLGAIPVFLNGVAGLGSPWWRPHFPDRFEGAPQAGIPARAVAVAESLVFMLQVNLVRMARALGPAAQVRITGGLARIDGLCQRLADLSGSALARPPQGEATALGVAALLAGCPPDWMQDAQARRFTPRPNPGLTARYARWRSAMAAALCEPVPAEPAGGGDD